MAGLYSKLKTWAAKEILTASDLNAEFSNIITNFVPPKIDDHSATVAEMQTTTTPGALGSESQATHLAGEIERLRYAVARLIGGSKQWYEAPSTDLSDVNSFVGTPRNRIVSGKTRTASGQLIALVPSGSTNSVTLEGATTDFIYYVEGVEYTISSDVTLANLTLLGGSPYGLTVEDGGTRAYYADGQTSKYAGEDGLLARNTTVSNSSLAGSYHAYKVVNGAAETEYFMGEDNSTVEGIRNCRRGYFFDNADAPIPAVTISDTDAITQLSTEWIFAMADLTLSSCTEVPAFGPVAPSAPSAGDTWFDTVNDLWKDYQVGPGWAALTGTLIGVVCLDATAALGARTFNPFKPKASLTDIPLYASSSSVVYTDRFAFVNTVFGSEENTETGRLTWDMATDLDTGVSEGANTKYYFYLSETHKAIISDIPPRNETNMNRGWTHPHHTWRCLGRATNDGSSNLTLVQSFGNRRTQARVYRSASITTSSTVIAFTTITSHLRIKTFGNPVVLSFDSTTGQGLIKLNNDSAVANADINGYIGIFKYDGHEAVGGATQVAEHQLGSGYNGAALPANFNIVHPSGSFSHIIDVEPGEHEFFLKLSVDATNISLALTGLSLTAREL